MSLEKSLKECVDATVCITNPEEIRNSDVNPLAHNTTLRFLMIKGELGAHTTMTIEITQLVADILKNAYTLTHLDLDFDEIPAAEMKLIAEGLKNNTTLTNLTMNRLHIDDEGFNYIVDSFKDNYILTHIAIESSPKYFPAIGELIKSKKETCEKVKETLEIIASGNTPEKTEEYIDAIKFYQATNPVLFGFEENQHNNINDYIQKKFFHLTAVCKDNSSAGDAIDGSVLPKHEWNEIFSYLKISDVVIPTLSGDSGDAVALSGITDDADVIGS